jgi:hypothetical protein
MWIRAALIRPLLFVDGHVYFISNGSDDEGKGGVIRCEIDIETGKKADTPADASALEAGALAGMIMLDLKFF